MSGIFSCRRFWVAQEESGENDVCDTANLAVVPIAELNADCVVVGTFGGKLRVYNPTQGNASATVLAAQLKEPILAVSQGPFTIEGRQALFGILHPKTLVLYNVHVEVSTLNILDNEDGGGDDGNAAVDMHAKLEAVMEYSLDHDSAANVASGCLRSDPNSFCVQSMDGKVSYIEKGRVGLQRKLPNCLLPGPICIVESNSSIVTCTSSYHIESYKFLTLTSAAGHEEDEDDDVDTDEERKSKHGKQVKPDWSLSIGERALDVKFVSSEIPKIIVLGERSIFWIGEDGDLLATKRLEVDPMCFLPYRHIDNSVNILIGTYSKQLIVLKDTNVIWTALLDFIPVALRIGTFGGVKGMIIALEETGRVGCFYLGTDPNIPVHDTVQGRDLDYDTMDREMREFQKIIKDSVLEDSKATKTGSLELHQSELTIVRQNDNVAEVACSVRVRWDGPAPLERVCVTITTYDPLSVEESTQTIEHLGTSPVQINIRARCTSTCSVYSTEIFVNAISALGDDSFAKTISIPVPVSLFSRTIDIGQERNFLQYNLAVDSHVASISDLIGDEFPDINPRDESVAFRIVDESIVVVKVRRGTGTYAIAGENLAAMWLIAHALCTGINRRFRTSYDAMKIVTNFESDSNVKIPPDNLPPLQTQTNVFLLESYFELIDDHFHCRKEFEQAKENLARHAKHLQALQKQLLMRFKDKTPKPLEHLDSMMVAAHDKLMKFSEEVKSKLVHVKSVGCTLAGATKGLLMLLRIHCGLDDEACSVLEGAFSPLTVNHMDDGWEERISASILALLKTALSSREHDHNTLSAFVMPANTKKLRRYISELCEKLSEGGRRLRL